MLQVTVHLGVVGSRGQAWCRFPGHEYWTPNHGAGYRVLEGEMRRWISGATARTRTRSSRPRCSTQADSVRASLPNRYCDPKIAARLFDEVFEEHALCDDLGINIVTTEHHAGINNLCGANPLVTAIVARITKKVEDPEPRDAGDGPRRSGPGGRGVRHARRDLEGAARRSAS